MIRYVTGDATRPQGGGQKVIAHICNNLGAWGSGFVVALSQRSTVPELSYRSWHDSGVWEGDRPFQLGEIQVTGFDQRGVLVANMIAQRGIRRDRSAPPAVDYKALWSCLDKLGDEIALTRSPRNSKASVHMPRIGCGLGGGSWDEIEPIIDSTLTTRGVSVTVYDL